MATTLFSNLTEKDKNEAIERLIAESTPHHDFFLMVSLSITMAALGLLVNSAAVIIGSMLIAPILSPILSLSLGIVIADMKLIMRSFWTIAKATLLSLPIAMVTTWIFVSQLDAFPTLEIISRTDVTIIAAVIGFVAGFAASFATIKPQLNNNLPGVAIAVALIPPLAVSGIGIAQFDWNIASSAFILFLLNIATITFGSMIVFNLMNFYVKRGVAEKAVEKEDKALEQEEKKAEEKAKEKEE